MKGIGVHIVYVLNSEDEDAYIILSVMIYFYEKKYNYLFQLQTCFVYNAYSKLIHEICIEGEAPMIIEACCML